MTSCRRSASRSRGHRRRMSFGRRRISRQPGVSRGLRIPVAAMYTPSAWGPVLVVAYVVVFIHQYHKSGPMHTCIGELCGAGPLPTFSHFSVRLLHQISVGEVGEQRGCRFRTDGRAAPGACVTEYLPPSANAAPTRCSNPLSLPTFPEQSCHGKSGRIPRSPGQISAGRSPVRDRTWPGRAGRRERCRRRGSRSGLR